jgi:malic enzyme
MTTQQPAITQSGGPNGLHGIALLNHPVLNKGTAFTEEERSTLGLHGLLPPHVESLDEQVVRAYETYQRKDDDLERHIYLRSVQDTNEVLFYRLLLENVEEMTPIVYTPVVALACQQFSHIYRCPRGLFISYPLRDAIATLLRNRPNREDGLSDQEARSRFWFVDKSGLLHSGRTDLTAEQRVYAQPWERLSELPPTLNAEIGLADVIGKIDATILIGLSTAGGAFTEAIVREMARKVQRPIIFPLSNPTAKSEANADDLMRWTDGRALVATGSPFAPVSYEARRIPIAQCNNIYIFPAIGLGVVASGARRVTDTMILAAARALAGNSPALKDASASLLPALTDLRKVAVSIAIAVGREAQQAGVAPKGTEEELRQRVMSTQWTPAYASPG